MSQKRAAPNTWNARKGGFKRQRKDSLSQQQKMEVDKEVKKVIARKTDYKAYDRNLTAQSVDFTGSTFSILNGLVRGDLGNQFDGDDITPKWVRVRYAVNTAQTVQDSFNKIRVLLIQSNLLGTPTVGGVLDLTVNGGTAIAPLAQRLEERLKSYKILWDKTHTICNSGKPQEAEDVFIPGNRLKHVVYTQTGTLSIISGDICMMVISDDGVADYPDFEMVSRIKFS